MTADQSIHSQLLEKVPEYRMPPPARDLVGAHLPLILTGITASGKNTITDHIVKISDYRQVVTHTTRPPREGEVHAKDYHFISEQEMIRMMTENTFVEVQTIHGDTVYGISIKAYQDVLDASKIPLLNIDVQGVEEISRYVDKLRPVFLLPPSFENWMEMMDKRGRMSHPERLRRMHSARDELQKVLESDMFFLVVNEDVPRTAQQILGDVHDAAEQHRNREVAQLLFERLKTI